MSSDRQVPDNDSFADLPKAVSLTDSRPSPSQQPSTVAHAPAFDQFNDKLFKSIQQCIGSALEPLVQRIADIEKAMVIRTASIAEQVSTVSLNQQILHQSLLQIMEKVDQLQFEEQSVYTDQESLSSFDIPAKRSARNADSVSVYSTEASGYQSNSDDDDDDDDSVCTETAGTLNQFQVPEAASISAERYNQFTRIESRKYTAKFSNANQATPSSSSSSTDQVNTANASNNDKLLEQIKQVTKEASQIIPGIPVVPLPVTTNATTTNGSIAANSSVSANTPASSVAPNHPPKAALPPAAPTLPQKDPVLTTALVTTKAQPITIAPIIASIPAPATPASAVQSPPLTTSIKASLEAASSASDPSSVPVPQAEPRGNRSASNQKRNRRGPIAEKFNYVYFEYATASRTKCSDIRTKLTGIGIPSKKMLDVYFPGKRVAAVLFPEDYLDTAIDMLQKNNFTVLTDFNPLDSKNLGDPKYKSFSKEERNEILRGLHEKQMCRAIDRIRGPTRPYVYEDFYKKRWISKERYTDYLADMFRPLPERKPKD
ncbi:hypothetical protein V8B55DRAFT_1462183 [Mucor lusitanicus]